MGVHFGNDEYDAQEISLLLAFRKKEQAIKTSTDLSSSQKKEEVDDLFKKKAHLLISCPDLLPLNIKALEDLLKQAKAQEQLAPANKVPLSQMDNTQNNAQTVAVNLVDDNQAPIKKTILLNAIVDRYNQSHKLESATGYKTGYTEPKIKNDGIHLQFPTPKESLAFMQTLAEEKKRFFVLDKDNHVRAYSTGDGVLYKADGTAYEKGAVMESSNLTQADVARQLVEAAQAPSRPVL